MKVIRVAVVDEHDIFRRGLVTCLDEVTAFSVVFEGPAGPVIGTADVGVVSARAAEQEQFDSPVVICGPAPGSEEHRGPANRVMAILDRSRLDENQLVAAVYAAATGLRIDQDTEHRREPERLANRSIEILRLLAEGASTLEISNTVGFAERTVKSVIQQIERELGVRNRAHAVAAALRLGLMR